MTLFALTGGIGSGKSTIAKRFVELGATAFDADQFARDAVAPGTPGLTRVVERFGDRMLNPDGSLNRAKLGEVVFADEAARSDLEAIVHPEVQRLARQAFAQVYAKDPRAVIVYEIPLLVESQQFQGWDHILVAHAPEDVRVDRLVKQRGMTEADARARIASQASDADRLRVADEVIHTGASESETIAQVDRLWRRFTGSAADA